MSALLTEYSDWLDTWRPLLAAEPPAEACVEPSSVTSSGGIVHVGTFRRGNGMDTSSRAVISGLAKRGAPQCIIGLGHWDGTANVEYVTLDETLSLPAAAAWSAAIDRIRSVIDRVQPSTVVAHTDFPHAAWVEAAIRGMTGIEPIVVLRGFIASVERLDTAAGRELGACMRSFRVSANSRFLRDIYLEKLGLDPAKISVIRHGFDPKTFYPGSSERPNGSPLKAVFAGRCDFDKGPDVFVRAIAEAKKRGIHIKGVLMGGRGTASAAVDELIREHQVANEIEVTGRLPLSGVAAQLRDADIMISSVRFEGGLGCHNVEAFASGTPIIASRVGGQIELIEDSGAGVHVGLDAPAEIADRLVELAASPDGLAAMKSRALEFCAREGLHWDAVVERWARLLRLSGTQNNAA
jgi:glycosyltransferase involved in cell wall biosynthesis